MRLFEIETVDQEGYRDNKKYYHCSSHKNFSSIKKIGLKINMPAEHPASDGGIYLFNYLDDAIDWATDEMSLTKDVDIWEVTKTNDLIIMRDDHEDLYGIGSYVCYDNISPENLKFIKTISKNIKPKFNENINTIDQEGYRIPRAHREEVGCSECGKMEGLEQCGTYEHVADPMCPTCRKRWGYKWCDRCKLNHMKGVCPQVGAIARD
jgi:predicted nuclease of predicted toxin-antitoxin system